MMNYCLVLSYFRIILTITTCYHQNALHLLKNNLCFNQTLCLTWTRKHSGMWRRCLNMSNLCHNVNLRTALKANKTGRWLLVFVYWNHIGRYLILFQVKDLESLWYLASSQLLNKLVNSVCHFNPIRILCATTELSILFYFLVAENTELHFAFVKQ